MIDIDKYNFEFIVWEAGDCFYFKADYKNPLPAKLGSMLTNISSKIKEIHKDKIKTETDLENEVIDFIYEIIN